MALRLSLAGADQTAETNAAKGNNESVNRLPTSADIRSPIALVLDEPEIRALENGQLVQRSYAFALPFSETDSVPVLSKARFPLLPDMWEVSFVAAPVLDYDVVVRIASSTDNPDIVRCLQPTDEELGFLEMLDKCWQTQDVFRDRVKSLGLGNREFVRGRAGEWLVLEYDRSTSPFLYTFERTVS